MAGRTGWAKHKLDLAKAGEMLRDYAKGSSGDPLEAYVFTDRRGRHRRINATYPDGWTLQVNFALDGRVSSFTLACTMRATLEKAK